MTFKKESFDPLGLTKDVMKESESLAVAKNLYLKLTEPTQALPQVLGDIVRVREVLTNLIGNAVKYTESGGVDISLKTDGKFVKILVIDTGRGISMENQKLLFKKFQQAASSIYTRDALKGTGLGLYISKLMMEGIGGKVELDSSVEGKGSIFSMSIPVN
jgi:two-component system sensor histidine kinase TorS